MSASWRARVAAFVVRRRVKPALGDMSDIARVRSVFGAPLPAPRGVRYTPARAGRCARRMGRGRGGAIRAVPDTTLLYLHGGGFVGCSPRTHRPLTAALARQGLRVFVPDYRLAPEHPFPAAPRRRAGCLAGAAGAQVERAAWWWPATAPAATWRWA